MFGCFITCILKYNLNGYQHLNQPLFLELSLSFYQASGKKAEHLVKQSKLR